MANNNISNWFTNQLVTADQMNAFSQDLYQRFTATTEVTSGIILSLNGNITQVASDVTLPAGSFRFPDSTESYLPFTTGIFGNASSATVAVTGNGYIVARYSISPTSINQTNYTISVTYLFVTSVVTLTDCIICVITSGVISGYGTYLIYLPATNSQAITGTATNLAITPANLTAVLAGYEPGLGFTPVQQGGGTGQTTTKVYVGWDGTSRLKAQVSSTDLGNIVFDSQLTANGYGVTSSGSGWLELQDGFKIQMLNVTSGGSGVTNGTYPIPFSTSGGIFLSACMGYQSSSAPITFQANSTTTTGFTGFTYVDSSGTSGISYMIIAIGY